MVPLAMTRSPSRPRMVRQRGVSLLFAMITVVALSLAAVAMIRSVDTGTTILGNLSFKQDTLLATDEATRQAIRWLEKQRSTDPNGLHVSQIDQGYWAHLVPNLGPTTMPATARTLTLANQITARYLIMRLCSEDGSASNSTNQCPRPLGASSQTTSERGEINSQNAVRIGTTSVAEYYRIVVRAQGPRNTVSTTETLVHF